MTVFNKSWIFLKNEDFDASTFEASEQKMRQERMAGNDDPVDEWQDTPRLPEATSGGETVTCPMCGNDNAMHMMVPEVGSVLICQCGIYHTM